MASLASPIRLLGVTLIALSSGCAEDSNAGAGPQIEGKLRFACDFPADTFGRHACTDSYSKHDLGPGRATLEGVCMSTGGVVVPACPSDGKVGGCVLLPPGGVDYGVTTLEWAYAPTLQAEVRADCARRGYDFINPDGTVEPATDDESDAGTMTVGAGRRDAGRGTSGAGSSGGSGGSGGSGAIDAGQDAGPPDAPSSTAVPVSISVGDTSAVLLYDNGEVRLFGDYANNRICDNLDPYADVVIAGTPERRVLRGALAVDNGGDNACIVHGDGTVRCCGADGYGQKGAAMVGGGSTSAPVATNAGMVLTGATQVSMGETHACARLSSGALWCWGSMQYGATGNGNLSAPHDVSQVVGVGGTSTLGGAVSVSAGVYHSCATLNTGKVVCWGFNANGQLGAAMQSSSEPSPLEVVLQGGAPLSDVVDAQAGFTFSCALDTSGAVWCWGSNEYGQLGDDSVDERSYAAVVLDEADEPLRAEAISLGVYHACALLEGGGVACWGANNWAQLGDGTTDNRNRATPVPAVSGAIAVSAGGTTSIGAHTCALWPDGTVKCWGSHSRGQFNTDELPGLYSTSAVTIEGL